jgi:hypothetical protein
MTDHKGTLREVREYIVLLGEIGNVDVSRMLAKLDTFLAAVPDGLGGSLSDIADINLDYAEADLMLEEGSLQKSISAAALLHEATKGE